MEHELVPMSEFRSVVEDLNGLDEVTLLRFLRARDHNVKRAEEMLRRHIQWREDNNIDGITKWVVPEEIKNELKIYFTGLDKNGFPVYMAPVGLMDGRKMTGQKYKQDSIRFAYYLLELMLQHCKKLGVSKFTAIVDNEGLTFWKCAHWDTIQTLIKVFLDFEANYPETLRQAFVVNTPSVFWQAFNVVKPVVAGKTLDKIQFFDSDKTKWYPSLLEKLPEDSLPNEYGGSAKLKGINDVSEVLGEVY